jgi:hypothetical protein
LHARLFRHTAAIQLNKVAGIEITQQVLGHSRIENHHYALKSFFAFLKKSGDIGPNPAQALPLLITRRRQVTKPISAHRYTRRSAAERYVFTPSDLPRVRKD